MAEITNFIKTIMENDLQEKRVSEIVTRFPPEPNAYLHIGHARAIVTNFELAKMFKGRTNLRFDDTNPAKEDQEFVDAIIEDIHWLGYQPDQILFGSDYFDQTYDYAIELIKKGFAYVCDLSQEEISTYRGTLTEGGVNSPYRNRSIQENLELFENMKNGVYKDGEKVLRAKIDMSSPNINMRDPVLYRILHISHHNTGDQWCIYPMYDFAHPLQDAIEGITHSLCSIEYDNHRPLYDWVIEHCQTINTPHQYEFGRLNIANYSSLMSKRYLKLLVDSGSVIGYDDPRLPTLVGLRRRGFTPNAIKNFILDTGLSRINSTTSIEMLEHFLREDLKLTTIRPNVVINPLKMIITNYPENQIEYLEVMNNNENEELGSRKIAFSREVYIEREDFLEEKPDKHWKRLSKGIEVRLMHAYFVKCNEVIKDEKGNILEIHCSYDPNTKSGSGFNERKPNGNIHFVEVTTALPATFHLFDALILEAEENNQEKSLTEKINKNSWEKIEGFVELSLKDTVPLLKYQFVRNGYYCTDRCSTSNHLHFNRICTLKSSFSK